MPAAQIASTMPALRVRSWISQPISIAIAAASQTSKMGHGVMAGFGRRRRRPGDDLAQFYTNSQGVIQIRQILRTVAAGLDQQHLHVAERTFAEAAFAIGQVEIPQPHEALVVAERAHRRQAALEAAAPGGERAGVAVADVLEMKQLEIARARRRAKHRADRRDEAARKDMTLDEVDRPQRLRVAVVLDRDRLDQGHAVGAEQVADLAKIVLEVVMADRLDHLDRDQLVVAAGEVAVVLAQHRDPVLEPGRAYARAGELVLLARDRRGGHVAAVAPRRVQGETAPAAAELDHAIARRQRQLATDALEL